MSKPLQLPYGLTTFKEGSLRSIDQEKIAAFERATPKKTAYDKAKEEANAKKKREEEETKVIYEDFVKSFDDGSGEYNITLSSNAPRGISCSKRHFAGLSSDVENTSSRKRNLDMFLEEIKSNQQKDYFRTPRNTNAGSFFIEEREESSDSSGPRSLHLTSLPPSTTQQSLSTLLLPYGKVASINILPARSTDDQFKKGVSAFVTFEDSRNAEKAKSNLDGAYLGQGWRAKVIWGKELKSSASYVDIHKIKLPFNAKQGTIGFNRAPPPGGMISGKFVSSSILNRIEVVVSKPKDLRLLRRIHRVIEKIVEYGVEFEAFLMKKECDNPNYEFLFDSTTPEHVYYRWKLFSLLNGDFPYKWSKDPFQMFTNGAWWIPPENTDDDDDDFSEDNFEKKKQMAYLGPTSRRHFDWLLREISYRRGNIARAMSFAIEHASAADEIVEILISSLILPRASISTKIARLYLVSDILHNSSIAIPNVWKYRQLFEQNLSVVFQHFSEIYKSFDGRIKADNFRRQIVNITSAWESWIVFGQGVLENFLEIFLGKKEKIDSKDESSCLNSSRINEFSKTMNSGFGKSVWKRISDNLDNDCSSIDRASCQKIATQEIDGLHSQDGKDVFRGIDSEFGEKMDRGSLENLDGEPMENLDGEPMENLDGEPMENLDGEPMENLDGEPMENLDGEPMENLDGEPMENLDGESMENLDGEPMENLDGEPMENLEESIRNLNDCYVGNSKDSYFLKDNGGTITKNVLENDHLSCKNLKSCSVKFDLSLGKNQAINLKSLDSFSTSQDENLNNCSSSKMQNSRPQKLFSKRMKASDGFSDYNWV
ncbi:hypothetical protein PORY_000738 [Pneumocystis oryctolagi]|uniref:Uncharacterized protein n=1 Tax=Pneumocystis oryctolagi TaxID=42067 RepID=A0ACB7CFU2_9ASCO|nr:hypothetical protein PORY_000738 [Pneumocystis oryctolagi]